MRKTLTLIAAVLCLAALGAHGEDWQGQPIGPFGTLNNRDNSFAIPSNKAQDLLNVDVTQGGKSVRKRKGYGSAFSLTITTSPVHGIYNFYDATGNDVSLFFNDTRITASISGSAISVLSSTGPNGATYQCTDALGYAYCANTSRTTLLKTNGVTFAGVTNVNSTGTMVAACPTRLAMAGFQEAPSRIDFSAETDFTSWLSGSLGTSGAQFTINAPGAKITHIVYAFGRLMWFKDTSFGFILIGNQPFQSDWVVKTVSYDLGTNDNTSVYREGLLYFRGNDSHIYTFDGANYQRLSREIASTISFSQTRRTNSYFATTAADFTAGSTTPAGYLSTTISTGSLVLSTSTALSFPNDTAQVDWDSGTLSLLDSTTTVGSVVLQLKGAAAKETQNTSGEKQFVSHILNGSGGMAQQFQASSSYYVNKVQLALSKIGSPQNLTVAIYSDNGSNLPGSVLISATLFASDVGSTEQLIDLNFGSSTTITSGSLYWISLIPTAGPYNDTDVIFWHYKTTGAPFSVYSTTWTVNGIGNAVRSYSQNQQYRYIVTGTQYQTAGNIVSRSFDIAFTTNSWLWSWSTFASTYTTPAATGISFQTQTSADGVSWDSLISVSPGAAPTSTVRRYIRYKASLTGNGLNTPQLDAVGITLTGALRPAATWYSPVQTASSLTSWDTFIANFQNNSGTNVFSIRSATNTFSIASSTPTWSTITSGSIPTVSTGTFFQVRDIFTATSYSDNPKLDDVTVNWLEGLSADKVYATYFDDKIWWAVTAGTGVTTNNKILLYDLLNEGWLIYDLPVNGFLVRQNNLYFGSSSSGNIYKFGSVDNDNGSAINAYWKSKDFFGGDPFSSQEIANVSVVAKSVANSSMTVTYATNGQTEGSYTMPLYNAVSAFTNKNKNMPAGTVAGEFNVKFGNNAADQPFEVFGIQVGIREKSWVPTQ